jgi:hypothetical protein
MLCCIQKFGRHTRLWKLKKRSGQITANQYWPFGFHKEQSISLLTKRLSASPEGFCSMELEAGASVRWNFASRCTKIVIQKNVTLLSTMATNHFNTEGLYILPTDCIYCLLTTLTTKSSLRTKATTELSYLSKLETTNFLQVMQVRVFWQSGLVWHTWHVALPALITAWISSVKQRQQ